MTTMLDRNAVVGPETGLARLALIDQPLINHIVVVVDGSISMRRHVQAVRQQLRAIQSDLREQAKITGQQIRITIYQFGTEVQVLVFDTDVAVAPDVADRYRADSGSTALLDATAIGMDDLATTSALYGDHAFLTYVITDGEENDSQIYHEGDVAGRMANLPENWTLAMLVPDVAGRRYATDVMGVPLDNVRVWNIHSADGFRDAGKAVTTATKTFLTGRSQGVRGTRTLFSTGSDAVNADTVSAAVASGALRPAARGTYVIHDVTEQITGPAGRIQSGDFMARKGHTYVPGRLFYMLTKTETIQHQKRIVIVHKETGDAFVDETTEIIGGKPVGSPNVRRMIGLPEVTVKIRPDFNKDYAIFVQSTAPSGNRNLIKGQQVFVPLT